MTSFLFSWSDTDTGNHRLGMTLGYPNKVCRNDGGGRMHSDEQVIMGFHTKIKIYFFKKINIVLNFLLGSKKRKIKTCFQIDGNLRTGKKLDFLPKK